ncbi:hypothetical protein PEBR_30449 [Penicillium brasilianum]|uniref:Uncharacterized protein n=1 Tax=Penicillium brasilianum TaxID=104259 RepID=A0A1S9RFV8_PENBI|nr:hypothetical protein PEBR_30449 [Penicillium brasilianum]
MFTPLRLITPLSILQLLPRLYKPIHQRITNTQANTLPGGYHSPTHDNHESSRQNPNPHIPTNPKHKTIPPPHPNLQNLHPRLQHLQSLFLPIPVLQTNTPPHPWQQLLHPKVPPLLSKTPLRQTHRIPALDLPGHGSSDDAPIQQKGNVYTMC